MNILEILLVFLIYAAVVPLWGKILLGGIIVLLIIGRMTSKNHAKNSDKQRYEEQESDEYPPLRPGQFRGPTDEEQQILNDRYPSFPQGRIGG